VPLESRLNSAVSSEVDTMMFNVEIVVREETLVLWSESGLSRNSAWIIDWSVLYHGALNFVFNSFVQFLIESFKFGCYGADD
jgi:hypothetical protein